MNNYDGKVSIKCELATKEFDKQIGEVENKLNDVKATLEAEAKDGGLLSKKDVEELEVEAEKLSNKLVDLYNRREKLIQQQIPKDFMPDIDVLSEDKKVGEKVQDLVAKINTLKNALDNINRQEIFSNDDIDKTKKIKKELKDTVKELEKLTGKRWQIEGLEESAKNSNKINNNISKGIKSLKRFALSLFSIQTIYSLISRASSAWLSQDTELAQKLQNIWIGLGSFLEPLLNSLSNILLKGLGYLNVFIKALTGVDYIARANAKAINKQTEAQKKLNKTTQDYDFDVIRKQQDLSSSSITGDSISSGIEIPELDGRIVKKLQDLAKWLKENENLVKAVGIALGVTFGAIAIAKLLSNIGLLIGGKSAGLTGLLGILKVLGTIGIIAIGVDIAYTAITGRDLKEDLADIKKGYDDLNQSLKETAEREQELTDKGKKVHETFWQNYEDNKIDEDDLKKYKSYLDQTTDAIYRRVDSLQKSISIGGIFNGSNKKIKETQEELAEQLHDTAQAVHKLREQNEITDTEYDKFNDKLLLNIKQLDNAGISTQNLKEDYKKLTGENYSIKLTAQDDTGSAFDSITRKLYGLKEKIRSLLGGGKGSFGGGGGGGRGYAQGGIVTQPTRALIGEAGYPEAVVPMDKDYLSTLASEIGKYTSGGKGGVVNVYLDGRLIQRQVQNTQNNKDFATNN